MEKVVYLLWRDPRVGAAEFDTRLRREIGPRLADAGALGVQLNLTDDDARGAAPTFAATRTPIDALVSLWLHSANDDRRRVFDDLVAQAALRSAAYLVTESQPIVNTRHPPAPGERTAGFAQIALLQRPPRLTYRQWLALWLGAHTQVAIDTQDTYYYRQNVVVRALHVDAPRWDAIVEEGFPPAAFGDPRAFFAAAGDDEKYRRHRAAMSESSKRFIDLDRLDVVQTSQYVISDLAARPGNNLAPGASLEHARAAAQR